MDDIDFAQSMKRSASSSQRGRSVRRTDTSTVYGTAMSDSADGSVRVDLGGSIIGGDGMVGVTCPTTVTVRKGDTVLVQLVGARGTAQSPIVVGCVGRGDVQQGEINEAKEEADEAKTAAEQAKQSAKDAADAASDAQQSASDAADAAQDAIDEAGKATKAAGDAMDAATAAGAAAVEANTAARGAVAGLGQVQDVLGTLDWIREHGTYALTEDTTVDPSKVYYVRSGTAPDYTYAPVAEPKDEELATYYELSMNEALAEFVGAHLALMSDGLHVVSDASGYYIVLGNDAMRVYDPNGVLVAEYGDDIELYQAGVLALRLSDDGMKLFDGLGTDDTNVIAHFNENGVVLGQDDINKTHANVFFDPDEQNGGFGVYNVDENGVSSYTGIENGRLIVGGPNYDESNSEKLEATQQRLTIAAGWMAPEVGMANRRAGGLMFYGRDSSFNPTVDYRVDWNGNIDTSGKITAKGNVTGRYHVAKADIDSAASSRSANHYHRFAQARDTNDVEYAFVEAAKLTDGKVQNGISVHRKISGTDKYGGIFVQMDNSGNVSWAITNPANFRSTLGVTPVSLWSGNTNANITLSQSAANFARITIYYRDSDNQYSSVDVYSPNGKLVIMSSSWDGRFQKMRSVVISGTSVNTQRAWETDTVDNHTDGKNLIYITKVLGWYY